MSNILVFNILVSNILVSNILVSNIVNNGHVISCVTPAESVCR